MRVAPKGTMSMKSDSVGWMPYPIWTRYVYPPAARCAASRPSTVNAPSRCGSSSWNQMGFVTSASGGMWPARTSATALCALIRPYPVN